MKTLVKPLAKLDIGIYSNQSYRLNRFKSHRPQYKKFHTKWKFLLITMSFFTFIAFSDSPEISGNICNKFNTQEACNVW
tara:strand:- start:263 stop:499 length:237 start_codon:yes stop_codon:yes gene_type:complete